VDTNIKFNWNISKADFVLFKSITDSLLLTNVNNFNILSLEEKSHLFSELLLEAAHQTIPKCRPSGRRKNLVPYWTDECTAAVRQRRRAEKQLRKYKTVDFQIVFRQAKAKVKFVIKKAKAQYCENFCSKLNSNSTVGNVWKTIKQLSGKKASISRNWFCKNNSFPTDKSVADQFIHIFAGYSANSSITTTSINVRHSVVNYTLREISHLSRISENDDVLSGCFSMDALVSVLNSVNIKSSTGPDNIPYIFLRELPLLGKSLLLDMINMS
jgi:hypothetical protein